MKTTFDITDIKVYPFKNSDGKVKAFAQIVLNGSLKISGIKVIEGENGLFIGYPAEKSKDGKYFDIVHPVTREGKNFIQDVVLANYEKALVSA